MARAAKARRRSESHWAQSAQQTTSANLSDQSVWRSRNVPLLERWPDKIETHSRHAGTNQELTNARYTTFVILDSFYQSRRLGRVSAFATAVKTIASKMSAGIQYWTRIPNTEKLLSRNSIIRACTC